MTVVSTSFLLLVAMHLLLLAMHLLLLAMHLLLLVSFLSQSVEQMFRSASKEHAGFPHCLHVFAQGLKKSD